MAGATSGDTTGGLVGAPNSEAAMQLAEFCHQLPDGLYVEAGLRWAAITPV